MRVLAVLDHGPHDGEDEEQEEYDQQRVALGIVLLEIKVPVLFHIKGLVLEARVVEASLLLITHDLVGFIQGLEDPGAAPLVGVVDQAELSEGAADGGTLGLLSCRGEG